MLKSNKGQINMTDLQDIKNHLDKIDTKQQYLKTEIDKLHNQVFMLLIDISTICKGTAQLHAGGELSPTQHREIHSIARRNE